MAHPAGRPALLLARGVLALTATEVVVTALVVGAAGWLAGAWPAAAPPLVWALGAGAAAGLVWAAAEALARRGAWGLALGVVALGLLAPACAQAGDYAALRLESDTSLAALRALLARGAPDASEALATAAAAVCLVGPLLTARAFGTGLAAQVGAALAGAAVWIVAVAHAPMTLDATHVTPYLLLVVPRAVLLPALLALADRLGRSRPEVVDLPPAERATDPAAAHRVAWLARAADEALARGDGGRAAALAAEAHVLRPDRPRALAAARACVAAGRILDGAAYLRGARLAVGDPALADPGLAPLRAEPALWADAAPLARGGRGVVLVVALLAAAALGAAVAPAVLAPDVPAEVARRQVLAWAAGEPFGWLDLAWTLERGYDADGWRAWSMRRVAAARRGRVDVRWQRWAVRERALALWRATRAGYPGARAGFLSLARDRCPEALEAAARDGDPEAGLLWARALRAGVRDLRGKRQPDVPAARAWYRRAAEADPEAARELGQWLIRTSSGPGYAADRAEGAAWLRRAADAGDADALALVADLEAERGRLLRLAAGWLAAPPTDFEPAWLETGEMLLALGEPLAAEACLTQEPPGDASRGRRVRLGLVTAAAGRGATHEALARLGALLPGDLAAGEAERLRARLTGGAP